MWLIATVDGRLRLDCLVVAAGKGAGSVYAVSLDFVRQLVLLPRIKLARMVVNERFGEKQQPFRESEGLRIVLSGRPRLSA